MDLPAPGPATAIAILSKRGRGQRGEHAKGRQAAEEEGRATVSTEGQRGSAPKCSVERVRKEQEPCP